jgi:hypothetical protein
VRLTLIFNETVASDIDSETWGSETPQIFQMDAGRGNWGDFDRSLQGVGKVGFSTNKHEQEKGQ